MLMMLETQMHEPRMFFETGRHWVRLAAHALESAEQLLNGHRIASPAIVYSRFEEALRDFKDTDSDDEVDLFEGGVPPLPSRVDLAAAELIDALREEFFAEGFEGLNVVEILRRLHAANNLLDAEIAEIQAQSD